MQIGERECGVPGVGCCGEMALLREPKLQNTACSVHVLLKSVTRVRDNLVKFESARITKDQ